MRNKMIIMVIASLAFLSAAGGANASCVQDANTKCLTTTSNSELNGIVVKVTISGSQMEVQLDNNPVPNTALGIDKFYFNSNAVISGITVGTTSVFNQWDNNPTEVQANGFGNFISGRWQDPGGTDGIVSPLTFISTSVPAFQANSPEMAVHIRYDLCSGWVSNRAHSGLSDDGTSYGCTSSKIPEFTTIALPIAAMVGLVIIFHHRKRKEE